jgi:CRISPR-associated protein Cas1
MINEVLYCERLMYLEWVQGEFTDNFFTVDGRAVHRRADRQGGALPPPPAGRDTGGEDPDPDPAPEPDDQPPPYKARSLWLSSEALGMTAKIDVVEGEQDGRVVPIEYKRGKPPDVPEGAYLPERAQLCAQVLLLREHGYTCDEAQLYFAAAKRRVSITIDDHLIATTRAAASRAREIAKAESLPPPLIDSPKCYGCSLVPICLPDEVTLLARSQVGTQPLPDSDETDEDERPALRPLQPASDDQVPVYVQDQGARIGVSGECLIITTRDGDKREARLPNTSQICLLGNVQISTQAMRALFERNIPISFFTTGGWYCGRATGLDSKNIELRLAQFRAADNARICLALSRAFVVSKIKNCRTLLRRNHPQPSDVVLGELDQLARKAADAESIESLLGIEGTAARSYFGSFSGLIKGAAALSRDFDLDGRNRRPPKDPVNALLSFAYSLLCKELALTLAAVGLDPLLGFYHQPRFGRPALALDLMEEFRPLIADSTVIAVINNGVVTGSDFLRSPTGTALQPAARRRVILAHERRLDQLVAHPVFGYRISYRRVLEVQARLLGRLLLGEIADYPQFRTR